MPLGLDDDEVGERRPTTGKVKLPMTPRHPQAKAARSQPEGSPSHLYPPKYAGNVQVVSIGQVKYPVNDEGWEEELESYLEVEEADEWPSLDFEEDVDEGHPPEVSPEELKIIEEAAGQEEIERLLKMKVLEDPTPDELAEGSILTTRSVYDWRVREKRWKRRCRFVAREFRGGDASSSKTFAPTSSLSATRLLLSTHVLMGWKIMFADIKDAFLLVSQTRLVLVEQPPWWRPEELLTLTT